MRKVLCVAMLLILLVCGQASAQRFLGRVFGSPSFGGSCANGQCGVQSMQSYSAGSACASGNCGVQYQQAVPVEYVESRPARQVRQIVTRPVRWTLFQARRARTRWGW